MKPGILLCLVASVIELLLPCLARGEGSVQSGPSWFDYGMHVTQQYPNNQTGVAGTLRFVHQLPDGMLLVGSTLGAYLYDGCRWKPLPGVPMAYSLLFTRDGRMLIGSGGKVLELRKDEQNAYAVRTRVEIQGDENQVNLLGEDAHGGLVGCFGNGYFRQASPDQPTPTRFAVPAGHWIIGLACLNSGTFIVSLDNARTFLRLNPDSGKLEPVGPEIDRQLEDNHVTGFRPNDASSCWVHTSEGITYFFDGHTLRLAPWHQADPSLRLRPSCILSLRDGRLLVGSSTHGLSLFSSQGVLLNRIDINNGMPEALILSAAEDRSGGLWVVTTKSLLRFDSRLRFLNFSPRQGLAVHEPESVVRYRGRLYVGGADGLFVQNPDARTQTEAFVRVPGVGTARALLVSDDTLWIGDHTLKAIHGGGPMVSYPTAGLGSLLAPHGRKDLLLCGTSAGFAVLRKREGAWAVETVLSTEGRLIYSMGELHDNDYWAQLGTARVARLREVDGRWVVTFFGSESGLPNRWIDLGIVDGRLLVPFSPEDEFRAGVWDEERGRFVPTQDFTFYADNLGPHVYHPIYYRRNGEPLIRANSRNAELTPRIAKVALSAVQTASGSREECAFGAYQDSDGATWICHEGGVVRCAAPFDSLDENLRDDSLVVRGVVDLQTNRLLAADLRQGASLTLEPDQNWLHVQTALVEFRSEQHAVYRVMLEGFEGLPKDRKYLPGFATSHDRRHWSYSTERDFTNLPSGSYTLHVEALDGIGMRLRKLDIPITIKTPWYATLPARAAYGLLALAGFLSVIRLRERVLRRTNERLSRVVDDRTEELRQNNHSLKVSLEHVEKLAGEARESELRFRRLANEAPAMIWLSDEGGAWTFANETWKRHTGLDSAQSLRDGWQKALHPQDAPAFLELHRRAHAGRTGYATDIRLLRPDQPPITVGIVARPHYSEEGAFNGLIGICLDVTEVKQAQEERVQMERRLQERQRLESLGMLAGGIAHDFNNLLTVIMGNASILDLDAKRTPEEREMLAQILQATRNAAELCRQMLAYAGHGRYQVRSLDAAAIAQSILDLLRKQHEARQQLVLEAPDRLPRVKADEPQFRQLLTNLLTNALEALEGRCGRVTVRLGVSEGTLEGPGELLHAPATLPRRMLRLEIIDDGPGIAPEHLRKAFDPFFSTKAIGRGLGLSAVLGIVKSHEGVLRLMSGAGEGCRFWILFPCEEGLPSPQEAPPPVAAPPAHGRILLVDDEEPVRSSVSRLLHGLGFQCDEAGDGLQALELFQAEPAYDLVVLDLIMPGMDGRHVRDRLLALRPTQRILIISGYALQPDEADLLRGPNTAFLQKPFLREELRVKIAQLLQSSP